MGYYKSRVIELYGDSDGDGNADGAVLATATTSADSGTYCFADVVPGDYVVVEIQPALYTDLYDYDFSTDTLLDPDGVDTIGDCHNIFTNYD